MKILKAVLAIGMLLGIATGLALRSEKVQVAGPIPHCYPNPCSK